MMVPQLPDLFNRKDVNLVNDRLQTMDSTLIMSDLEMLQLFQLDKF